MTDDFAFTALYLNLGFKRRLMKLPQLRLLGHTTTEHRTSKVHCLPGPWWQKGSQQLIPDGMISDSDHHSQVKIGKERESEREETGRGE